MTEFYLGKLHQLADKWVRPVALTQIHVVTQQPECLWGCIRAHLMEGGAWKEMGNREGTWGTWASAGGAVVWGRRRGQRKVGRSCVAPGIWGPWLRDCQGGNWGA